MRALRLRAGGALALAFGAGCVEGAPPGSPAPGGLEAAGGCSICAQPNAGSGGVSGGSGASGTGGTAASAGAGAGAVGGAAGNSAGSGGTVGTAGAGGAFATCSTPPAASPSSSCGDGLRDALGEECDDGNSDDSDGCSHTCRVLDQLAVPGAAALPGLFGRRLGDGRHPIAASYGGSAVAFVDETTFDVGVSTFSPTGVRSSTVPSASKALQAANPVVGALACGGYVLSWTDFDGDGDELGIAVAKLDATGAIGKVQHANTTSAFSQHDQDLVVTEKGIVVAWVDDSDASTAPDLRYTILGDSLMPSGESTLAATGDAEGNLSLAPFASAWAAAWRSGQGDTESVMARSMGTPSVSWSIAGVSPGPADDKPGLVELDSTHLYLLYTEGVDTAGDGVIDASYLRGRVLDVGAPGDGTACDPPASMPSASHPNAVRVGSRAYIAWRSAGVPGDANGEDVRLSELTWSGLGCPTFGAAMQLPRASSHTAGDQRHPAIAASPLDPEGAIVAVWDDFGTSYAGKGSVDVAFELIPSPVVRLPGAM